MLKLLKVVLIIGVDETLRQSLLSVINTAFKDASVTMEKNPKQATMVAGQIHPTLFILEWDALETYELTKLLQRLRKAPSQRRVPIIGISNTLQPGAMAIAAEYDVSRLILRNMAQTQLPSVFAELKATLNDQSPAVRRLEELQRARGQVSTEAYTAMVEDFYKQHPEHSVAQIEYSNQLIANGKLSEGEAIISKLIEAQPNNIRAMNSLARIYLRQNRFSDAMDMLKKADIMSPRNLDRLVLMGDVLRNLQRNGEARTKYEQALDIDNEAPDAKKGMGAVELAEGNVKQALEFFRGSTSPEELAGFFNNAAILAVRRQEFEQAMRLYESAIETLESNRLKSRVTFNKGLAYVRWEKPIEAKESFSQALKLDPAYPKPQQQIARIDRNLPPNLSVPPPPDIPPAGSLLDLPAEVSDPSPDEDLRIKTDKPKEKKYSGFNVEIIEEDEENF